MHLSQHQIASGWDNTAGLAYIGELTAGGLKFAEPSGANHGYVQGKTIIRLDGLTSTVGINKQTFLIGLTFPQYQYVRTTFCGGGYSGKVTVKTRWQDNAFANFNCYLRLQAEGMGAVWGGYKDVRWEYVDLVVIP